MNTLITKRFNLQIFPQNFLSHFPQLSKKTPHNTHPFPRKFSFTAKTLTLCSVAASESLSCGGWDDPSFIGDPISPGESNKLHNFLNKLGINDKKYVFVCLLGFVCALAISRVKVSSIIAIPGCVIVFALGFSIGVFNGGKMNLDGNKRLHQDQIFKDFIEKLRVLVDFLSGVDVEIGNLKKGVRKGIENNQITVEDLGSFEKSLESINFSALNARKVIEGCIESLSIDGQDIGGEISQKSSKKKKEPGKYGFDFFQIAAGLFQAKSGSKSTKMKDHGDTELMDRKMNGPKQGNILSSTTKERHLNFDMDLDGLSGTSRHSFNDDAIRQDRVGETFGKASRMNVVSDGNFNFSEMDSNTVKSVFNREEYSYQTSRVQFMRNQRVSHRMSHPCKFESWASDDGLADSIDFGVSMEQSNTEASSLHEKDVENFEGVRSHFGGKKNDEDTYSHFLGEEMRNPEKEPSMGRDEASNECESGHSPSSGGSIDLQFNKYLTEANILVQEAKDCLRRQDGDKHAENAFYESAVLLSKAIDIRPMSLLAVGQLGNTYLLHGELKLRISRDLRALLTDAVSLNKRAKIRDALDDTVPREDKITSYLVNVCEECEELLIKAGRQYRLALSIDGNDMRALYNWGIALSLRGQLIADIGPVSIFLEITWFNFLFSDGLN